SVGGARVHRVRVVDHANAVAPERPGLEPRHQRVRLVVLLPRHQLTDTDLGAVARPAAARRRVWGHLAVIERLASGDRLTRSAYTARPLLRASQAVEEGGQPGSCLSPAHAVRAREQQCALEALARDRRREALERALVAAYRQLAHRPTANLAASTSG